jgi:hypothetical protein
MRPRQGTARALAGALEEKGKGKGTTMMHPLLTSEMAKAHREDLLREAQREQLAAEVLAHDPRQAAADRPRLVASAQAFLRVHGAAVPAEGRG